MSITSDIRAYADTALEQGKQVVGQAQTQITDVTEQANEFVGKLTGTAKENVSGLTSKATGAVFDLRSQAEKALNIDAIKTAVEPYLAQAKQYRSSVTDRAEGLVDTVKSDKRVAKVVATAESLTGVVVDTVQERVIKPVSSLTGRGATKTTRPAKKTTARSTKPASTRPAKSATKAPATKKTTAKAPAAKATASKPTSSTTPSTSSSTTPSTS